MIARGARRTTRVSPFRMILDVPVVGKIGGCVGRVIRTFQNGFAVKFIETHELADLTRLISRESALGRKLREDAA